MKIYKQTIANGHEWQPCCHCNHRFVVGEIITALSDDDGNCCQYWYCSECFDGFWFAPFPVPVEWDDDFCLVAIEDDKIQICPKGMRSLEYMARKERYICPTYRIY